eukprot:5722585-Amphidinium_carterae.1
MALGPCVYECSVDFALRFLLHHSPSLAVGDVHSNRSSSCQRGSAHARMLIESQRQVATGSWQEGDVGIRERFKTTVPTITIT